MVGFTFWLQWYNIVGFMLVLSSLCFPLVFHNHMISIVYPLHYLAQPMTPASMSLCKKFGALNTYLVVHVVSGVKGKGTRNECDISARCDYMILSHTFHAAVAASTGCSAARA